MSQHDRLTELMTKYKSIGLVKGGELLLPQSAALDFITALESLGIVILGCDGWRYADPNNPTWIVQDLTVDYSVSDRILNGNNPAKESADAVKQFLLAIPTEVDFVSIDIKPEIGI